MKSYPGSSHNRVRGDPNNTCAIIELITLNSIFLRTPLCQDPDDYGLVHGKLCSTLHTPQGVGASHLPLIGWTTAVEHRRNNTTTTRTQSRGNSTFILFLVVSRMNPLKHGIVGSRCRRTQNYVRRAAATSTRNTCEMGSKVSKVSVHVKRMKHPIPHAETTVPLQYDLRHLREI